MLTKGIPSCTIVRALYILQIQLNTIIHYRGQPLHIILLRNKIFTKKKTHQKLHFYTLELQKWPWKNKQNAHQCCNAWLGLQSTWKHVFQVCKIPFRYSSGSCEFCMSTAADFFFTYHGIYYHYAVKFSILLLLGAWHLVFCPLALLPAYTFSFLQFSLQLGIHLITVNIPCAVNGYRHQGVKEQKMNSSLQSKIEKMMISRE